MSDAWSRIREAMALARAVRRGAAPAAALESGVGDLRGRELPPGGGALLDLVELAARGPVAIGQLGQTLDGRIATARGHSHYVNGPLALDHLHRLRALVDAVVVGAATVAIDDPSLTTRRVEGPNPVRVVIDSRGDLPRDRRLFRDGQARTLVVGPGRPGAEPLQTSLEPPAILAALADQGLDVVLVEGGARTLSGFLAAGCLARLHLLVAPTLLGSGRPGIVLPEVASMDGARRFAARRYDLGGDTLFDLTPAA